MTDVANTFLLRPLSVLTGDAVQQTPVVDSSGANGVQWEDSEGSVTTNTIGVLTILRLFLYRWVRVSYQLANSGNHCDRDHRMAFLAFKALPIETCLCKPTQQHGGDCDCFNHSTWRS